MGKPKKIMYLMIFVYTVGWSIISLLRYYSFNARYFDLGVSMGYITYSVEGLTLSKFVQIFALKPIVYLLDPIAYAFSFQGLLVFQSFFLALGAYPVFMISLEKLKNGTLAALLSASYLLYFPLAGLNWFDFHYQALFPTLFLLGYWFYIKGKKSLSLTFMVLSGMVHYPYTVFPLLLL
jgi:Predicted membrane protein